MKGLRGRTGHFVALGCLALACVSLAGCGSQAPAADTQATVPATTVSSARGYAVPSPITVAYVQRVLNALEGIDGRATAEIVDTGTFDTTAVSELRSTFGDDQFRTQSSSWLSQIQAGLSNYKRPPGVIHDRVARVISGSAGCIFVSAVRDFSAVAVRPPAAHLSYIELTRLIPANDPGHLNPTGWVIGVAGYNSTGAAPSDPCRTSSLQPS